MTSPRLSLEDTITLLRSQLGVSWPNPWWPHGVPAFNDCAAFQSWALFGLNGEQPFQTLVSGLIERSGLEFHAGSDGIQRGDLLGLRWSAQVNYDHVGMALGPPNEAGVVQTIDANGGTNEVAISNRSVRNVHNFARPHYPQTQATGSGGKPLDRKARTMLMFHTPSTDPAKVKAGGPGALVFHVFDGSTHLKFTTGSQEFANGIAAQVGASSIPTDDSLIAALDAQIKAQQPVGTTASGASDDHLVAAINALGSTLGPKLDAVLAATKALNPPG